jgi:hypothetical protein
MMRFVAGVRWAVRAKDAGSAHMQCHMGATEDAGSRRPARPGGTRLIVLQPLGEETPGFARLETMRKRILLGLALAGLVVVALTGAVIQLARGQRPALLGTQAA